MEACEESEKTAKQQLMSCSNKGPVRSRRWSSSSDLEIESTAAAGGGCGSAAILSRSYSATAVVVAADGGGVTQRARGEEENRRRGGNKLGAGARLSRKLKEQRARFYIVRRCVSMLVCWRDTDDAH